MINVWNTSSIVTKPKHKNKRWNSVSHHYLDYIELKNFHMQNHEALHKINCVINLITGRERKSKYDMVSWIVNITIQFYNWKRIELEHIPTNKSWHVDKTSLSVSMRRNICIVFTLTWLIVRKQPGQSIMAKLDLLTIGGI